MFSSFNHISLRKILEISGNAVEVGALVLEDSIGGFPGYYCEQAGFACRSRSSRTKTCATARSTA